MGVLESVQIRLSESRSHRLTLADKWRVADNEFYRWPLRLTRVLVSKSLERLPVWPRASKRLSLRVAYRRHLCLQHRILRNDVLEGAKDGLGRHSALGPDVPLQVTNPKHQLRDRHRAGIYLQSK